MSAANFTFDVHADVYRLQRRPNQALLLANDGYAGVIILDPFEGRTVSRVAFDGSNGSNGVIDCWALRADGDALVVVNDEEGCACLLSLVGAAPHPIAHPPWPTTTGTPYDWRGDALWLKDPDSFRFALHADATVEEVREVDGTRALTENRLWRRAIDRLRRTEGRALHVEPERGQLLYVAQSEHGARVGLVGWVEQEENSIPVTTLPARIALAGRHFVVLHEYVAHLLDDQGNATRSFQAPEGFHYVDLDTLPPTDERPACVVILARPLDGRDFSRFLRYDLSST